MRATIASVIAAASLTVFIAAPRAQAPAFDLVIRNGRIVANLERHEVTEEKVIQSSFSDAH